MFHRKLKYGFILSLLSICLILVYIFCYSRSSKELKVVFLDVGQGDAILISQGSYQMLIDGGRDGKLLLNKLGKYVPFWDRDIEIVLATHPDQDHIAGLIEVLESYNVKTIIKTSDQSGSQTYNKFQEAINNEKAENIEAVSGVSIKFPEEARAEILYPFSEIGDIADNSSNDGSVVVKIVFGENSFLLTGDLPRDQEKIIMNSGRDLKAEFLKIAHHGSKYSTGSEFLEKVDPSRAIISVGKNNPYSHPGEEVLSLLRERNISILRTDEKGDVIFSCKKDLICDESL